MKYLIDVNALLAWGHTHHEFASVFHSWVDRIGYENICTCAISELGFLRISANAYRVPLDMSLAALDDLKIKGCGYIADCPPPKLFKWTRTGAQTTDAYLLQLAHRHKLRLATFDAGIPGAHFIE